MNISSRILQNQCIQLVHKTLYNIQKCNLSTHESIQKRNELFTEEQKRQKSSIGRIEKIEVRYLGVPEDVTLIMTKGVSTPYNCAQHLSENHCKRSALALLDGNIAWDMHRPLNESSTLQLLHFFVTDPHLVNKAFWRTCSFLLGSALRNAFKDEAGLLLHSFPGPNIKSGSFVHDIVLSVKGWKPSMAEMKTLSAEMRKLSLKDIKIERLDVDHELAIEIFKDNPYKLEQLPSISNQNHGKITLYRAGDHIDISKGPMVGSSSFVNKCTISSVHEIGEDKTTNGGIYRVQGVALPTGIILNHFAYGVLEDRSRKLNPARLPTEPFEEHSYNGQLA